MRSKQAQSKSVFGILEKDHHTIFQKLNQFYDILTKLRFEGKMNFGKNLSEASAMVDYFNKMLTGHMNEEETVLFPFLETHIPRTESMICLLLSEHDDFRNSLGNLRSALGEFKSRTLTVPGLMERVCEQGVYLIYLLRSHMWVESHGLYKVADKELRLSERQKLIKQLRG